jgi:type II secretory pathway pseudopilin PulG
LTGPWIGIIFQRFNHGKRANRPEGRGAKLQGLTRRNESLEGSQLPMSRIERHPSPRTVSREIAITLVEVLVSLSVLTVGFLSLVATIAQNSRLQRVTHEKHIAVAGAESILEDLRRSDFREILDDFGPSGTPGPGFDLVGLNALADDVDGHVGHISFILDETAVDSVAAAFELPRDLNGDGDSCDSNVSAGYRILPIRIIVEWTGAGGESRIEVRAVLTGREDSE